MAATNAFGRIASRVCVATFAHAEREAAAKAAQAADPYNATISQLLRGRAKAFSSTGPDTSVVDAAQIMAQRDAGSVLVVGPLPQSSMNSKIINYNNNKQQPRNPDSDGDGVAVAVGTARIGLVGIITERDIIRALPGMVATDAASSSSATASSSQTSGRRPLLVRDIMSSRPQTVEATATVGECMEIMINGHFRHLPVTDHGELIGVLSIRDLVEKVTEDHRTQVMDLKLQLGRLANVVGQQVLEAGNGGQGRSGPLGATSSSSATSTITSTTT